MNTSEYVLALDQSLTSTGYTIGKFLHDSKTFCLMDIGKIMTQSKKYSERERMFFIAKTIKEISDRNLVKSIIVENVFLGKNPKTANTLATLKGVIEGYLFEDHDFYDIKASETRKLIMNNGRATKEEVADYLKEIYKGTICFDSLGEFSDKQNLKKNSDMYDSVGILTAFKELKFKDYKVSLINTKEFTVIRM